MNRKTLGLAAALGFVGLVSTDAQQPARALIQLQTGERIDVLLVGRDGPQILYRRHDAPAGASAALPVSSILAGEFELEIDDVLVNTALRDKKWDMAVQLLLARVGPALPYLDIPDNNVVDPALQAGGLLMRLARTAARGTGERAEKESARYYQTAYNVFRSIGRASEWHPFGESGAIRAILCQIALGKLDAAGKALDAMRVPAQGDGSFGIYSLAKAKYLHARGNARVALDELIPSILYENKDVSVFPEALMLAAQCYEEINEIHRTRDVFYEVARIFPGTEWAEVAHERLVTIKRENLIGDSEDVAVTTVFFGGKDDMEQLVDEYLEKSEEKKEP
jgi:hypothetical protein